MDYYGLDIRTVIAGDAVIRGPANINENEILGQCLIEDKIIGPGAIDGLVYDHVYYNPRRITIDDINYNVITSFPDETSMEWDDEDNLTSVRMYLIIIRPNRQIAWENLQVAKVFIDIKQQDVTPKTFDLHRYTVNLQELRLLSLERIIGGGIYNIHEIGSGERKVYHE